MPSPATRVFWAPPANPGIQQYQVTRADALNQPFFFLQSVPAVPSGPNYDAPSARYFVDDPQGTATTAYRVQGFGPYGILAADTGPFVPQVGRGIDLTTRVMVDHNFGQVDGLRYVISTGPNAGQGVPQASIRIYGQADYLAGRTQAPIALVETLDDGRWVAPVFIEPGQSYVLVYSKDGLYGPDTTTITV